MSIAARLGGKSSTGPRPRQGKMDVVFLILVLLLLVFGLVMLFSSSYVYAYYYEKGDKIGRASCRERVYVSV